MKDAITNKIHPYIDALYPIIYLRTHEQSKADRIIAQLGDDGKKIIEWNGANGLVDFKTKHPLVEELNLADALQLFEDPEQLEEVFIVLKNVVQIITEPKVTARLQQLVNIMLDDKHEDVSANIIIVSPELDIPIELQKHVTVFDVGLPTVDEIKRLILDFTTEADEPVTSEIIEELALSFKGLGELEINSLLNLALQNDGTIDLDDKYLILQEKEQVIKKSGILEMVPLNEKIEDIGGLQQLKIWLDQKAKVFGNINKAMAFGVDMPKGVFILGMPGCGKSLAAKATAHLFNLPLLRLDIGRLMGKYVGESEANMRKAIELSEAISPCVLWIDEIEKAFVGAGSGGSEVTSRLFGFFLTWMQEKKAPVYVVATANDISNLPPELLRKGRFDETFFVDFPTMNERKQIFEIHMKKRKKYLPAMEYIALADRTEGYSGADIETVVKEAIEQAFVDDMAEVTPSRLSDVVSSTTSLSVMLKDKIKDYRENYKKLNIKPASLK